MDITTISLITYGALFLLLCWGVKKAVDMILEMTTHLADSYASLERDVMKNKEDILKLRSELIALEYYKHKSQREPRNARNDIRYENEVTKD